MPVELNTLITAVVRAVLDQLDTRPASVAQVLAPRDEALARQVGKRLGSAMQVCFQGQSAGQEPALYILPELSCPDMADLALGRGSSLAQREVLDLLLQGKQVRTLGFAYRAHAATAPDALLRLYEEYEARLAAFGLTELAEAAPEASRTRDCLITANHVAEAAATGARTLRAPQGAVVTPLAQDAAAERNMTILKDL